MTDGSDGYRLLAEDRFTIERRRIAILRYKQVFSIGNMLRAVLLALLQRLQSPRLRAVTVLKPPPRFGVMCSRCRTEFAYTAKALRGEALGSYVVCPSCAAHIRHDASRVYPPLEGQGP